jgi:hypothetical protein
MNQLGFARSHLPLILTILAGVALVYVWVFAVTAYAAEPLAFKGLLMGASEKEFRSQYPQADCLGSVDSRWCLLDRGNVERRLLRPGQVLLDSDQQDAAREVLTVGGAYVPSIEFTFINDALAKISARPHANLFATLSTALRDRYGAPASDQTEPIVTRAGVTYENRKLVWRLPGGEIRLTRYSGIVTESALTYLTPAAQAEEAAAAERARARAAKNL